MMNDKISIIVPVYNNEKYLNRCLTSIVKQTYKNIEAIVVDDGSLDKSLTICHKFAKEDSRFKILVQANHGVSVARNNGLVHATGKYICFIDGDDFVDAHYCESLIGLIHRTGADIAINSYYFDRDGKYYVILKPSPNDKRYNRTYSPEDWLRQTTSGFDVFLPVIVWGKLFKKSLFRNIRFPIGLNIAEDAATIWQLYLASERVSFENNPTYIYCSHKQSAVNSNDPSSTQWKIICQQLSVLLASQKNINFLKNHFIKRFTNSEGRFQFPKKNLKIYSRIINRYLVSTE